MIERLVAAINDGLKSISDADLKNQGQAEALRSVLKLIGDYQKEEEEKKTPPPAQTEFTD